MVTAAVDGARLAAARAVVASIPDPELPMVTLADLGIVREVTVAGDQVLVTLTPTFTGCPALREMHQDVRRRLADAGFVAEIRTVLAPAWTTDWITTEGRRKLHAAGIAPPGPASRHDGPVPLTLSLARSVPCPLCGSSDTERTSAFGATACRELHRCRTCSEPFEHMKEI